MNRIMIAENLLNSIVTSKSGLIYKDLKSNFEKYVNSENLTE
jgi:hypothetical protein